MGLITKEVEVTVVGRTKLYYKNKGYHIPERVDSQGRVSMPKDTKILVNVNDLSPTSTTKVECSCDNCGCKKEMTWGEYNRYTKDNRKYYCVSCNSSMNGDKSRKTKLKNSISFEKWCIENKYEDILARWNTSLNTYLPSEISFSSAKKIWFNCPDNIHEPELKKICDFTTNSIHSYDSLKCKGCNSFAQWGIENVCADFLEKYWDYNKNKNINPWGISRGTKKKVWINCQDKDYHDSYFISCYDFTTGKRCPFCNSRSGKIHPFDSVGQILENRDIINLWSSKNKKSPYSYAQFSSHEVYWVCENNKHNDYLRNVNNSNICNFRCPICVEERGESFLQEKVRLYFKEINYKTVHEYNCNLRCINPKTNYVLPYDNEVENLKLIIEIHGKHHYEINEFILMQSSRNNTTPEQELEYQQWKDKYKKDYALSQGYFYLEIPYWTDDENETWKKLINDKINSINNK